MNPFCATTNPEFIGQYFTSVANKCGEWHFMTHLSSISSICLSNLLTALSSKWEDSSHFTSSITFVHESPGSGKSSLNLAGNYLGMALLGTGEPLAGEQCCCWAVPCLWFPSLHIQAFGSSLWKSAWVRSPLSWRGTAPHLGLEVLSQWEEEEIDRWGFMFASGLESMLDVYPHTCGFPGFSWCPLDLLTPSTQVYSPFL